MGKTLSQREQKVSKYTFKTTKAIEIVPPFSCSLNYKLILYYHRKSNETLTTRGKCVSIQFCNVERQTWVGVKIRGVQRRAPSSAGRWGSKSHAEAPDRRPPRATSSSVLVRCHSQIYLLLFLLKLTAHYHVLLSFLLPLLLSSRSLPPHITLFA